LQGSTWFVGKSPFFAELTGKFGTDFDAKKDYEK